MRRLLCLLSVFSIIGASDAAAQVRYGDGTPGFGGIVPEIRCPQAWLGNTGFSIDISGGIGAGTSILVVAGAPATTSFMGAPIWVDPGTLILQQLVPLGGAAGVAGAGSASYPLPINLPALPFLAGYKVFAQYVVIDFSNGAPAVTKGVEIELTMPPQVFVGSSVGGSTDPSWLVEAAPAPPSVPAVNSTFTDNVGEAVFTNGGTNLYVVSSITSRVNRADLSGPTPVWSTLYQFASGTVYGPQVDEDRGILWAIGDPGTGQRELTGIDINIASPTYGQLLFQTTGFGNYVGNIEPWALSPNGNFAVVPGVFSPGVFIYDTDPASPTFLTNTQILFPPTSGGLSFTLDAAVTYDNDQILILRVPTGQNTVEVARYWVTGGLWIDHNPASFATIQNMGVGSAPSVPFGISGFTIAPARTEPFFCVSGWGGGGWCVKVEYAEGNPFLWNALPATGAAIPNAWACGLSRDDRMLAVASWSGAGGFLEFFDTATMTNQFSVSLGTGLSNLYTVAWR